jgi:hypothetical protein
VQHVWYSRGVRGLVDVIYDSGGANMATLSSEFFVSVSFRHLHTLDMRLADIVTTEGAPTMPSVQLEQLRPALPAAINASCRLHVTSPDGGESKLCHI